MRALRYGESGLLLELDDEGGVAPALAALQHDMPAGVTSAVPGARTIYLGFDPAAVDFDSLADVILQMVLTSVVPAGETGEVRIAVTYDGADLVSVSERLGLSIAEVVSLHSRGDYCVAFCGFMPGFAYLTGLSKQLWVPRKAVPRTKVPAGAVAIADRYSAIYPRESPGGWQIIGHTDATLWNVAATPPALLRPGMKVRFIPAPDEK